MVLDGMPRIGVCVRSAFVPFGPFALSVSWPKAECGFSGKARPAATGRSHGLRPVKKSMGMPAGLPAMVVFGGVALLGDAYLTQQR